MKTYKKTEHPKRAKAPNGLPEPFSVDVVVYSENRMLNIGYYSYDRQTWDFHTNTMTDMDEVDFTWCYPPRELTNKFKVKH